MQEIRPAFAIAATVFVLLGGLGGPAAAQPQIPLPAPDPAGPANIFYGAVPTTAPGPVTSTVLVFVHGLGGTADNWWLANNTYQMAFVLGYRTAFVELVPDASIVVNGEALRVTLPIIADHYDVEKMVLIGHSKGGVDLQVAMIAPGAANLVKAVFTLASPNQGTELADWAFGPGFPIAGGLGLLSPGVFSLRTQNMAAFRAVADPIFRASGIPFYTMEATQFTGNPITTVTGAILKNLVPDENNDGFVTVPRATLPNDYAIDVEELRLSHFEANNGDVVMPKIHAALQGLEFTLGELRRIQSDGFGDTHNTWGWSMEWFQGKLYVGTGREITCATLLTSDIQQGSTVYPIAVLGGGCPDVQTLARSLAAEIWRYDPATGEWLRVFKSPENIFLMPDDQGQPIYTARDVGFRGMTTFVEPDGTEALYVGGVTSGSMFDRLPQFATNGFPPPRILRTTDGTNWQAIPQLPSTFLGNIGRPDPGSDKTIRSMRSLTGYNGMLFATAGTFTGVGRVIASANPAAGNNAWFDASPSIEEMPVWDQEVFADRLYVTTGNKEEGTSLGYGVFWTDATGTPPYQWHPVVTQGGFQDDPTVRGPNGLSMAVFKDQLYVGTNRPTELIRVNADGTWDLLVGESRTTPHGVKTPLTGMGLGFGSWFNGHFWRMETHEGHLYLGTWDWSLGARFLGPLGDLFWPHFGFDLYRTNDGIHWEAVTRNGFGDKFNYGGRSLKSTPAGLFIASTRPQGGTQVWHCPPPGCTENPPDTNPPAPTLLTAESEELSGRTVMLSWQPSPGAVRYRVYRATVNGIDAYLGSLPQIEIPIPGLPQPVTLDAVQAGQLDFLCLSPATESACLIITAIKSAEALPRPVVSVPDSFKQVGIVINPFFSETAPTDYQSLYFVLAEDAEGNLSKASNFVGGPSKAAAVPLDLTPPIVTVTVSPEPNEAGWHHGPVQVIWSVSDPDTPVISADGCGPAVFTDETSGITLTCSAKNGNGLTASASVTIKIDKTPPVVTFGPAVPPANAAGWNNTDVSIAFAATDTLSGMASTSIPSPLVLTTEGANVTGSVTAIDVAGNAATYASPPVNIDKTAPEAYQRFDPATFDLVTFGLDGLSGVAGGPIAPSVIGHGSWRDDDDDRKKEKEQKGNKTIERRTYRISDLAGNALTLVEDVKRAGHEVKGEIRTLQYNDASALTASDNRLQFEYAVDKKTNALKELEQKMRVGKGRDRQEMHAKFEGKKNQTKIETQQPEKGKRLIELGLRLLRVRTANGQLTIGVNPL